MEPTISRGELLALAKYMREEALLYQRDAELYEALGRLVSVSNSDDARAAVTEAICSFVEHHGIQSLRPFSQWFDELEQSVLERLIAKGLNGRNVGDLLGCSEGAARAYLSRRKIRLTRHA